MKNKNFLAITNLKMVITFLFALIFLLVVITPSLASDDIIKTIISPGGVIMNSVSGSCSGYDCPNIQVSGLVLVFILNVIFWYLYSCIIVWIYESVKKKK